MSPELGCEGIEMIASLFGVDGVEESLVKSGKGRGSSLERI